MLHDPKLLKDQEERVVSRFVSIRYKHKSVVDLVVLAY